MQYLNSILTCLCLVVFFPACSKANSHPLADKVIILANADIPESVELAKYYSQQRGVPEKNLILISAPDTDEISWPDYVSKIHNPLRTELVNRGLLTVEDPEAKDLYGRLSSRPTESKFAYMLVCRGIPFKVGRGFEGSDAELWDQFLSRYPVEGTEQIYATIRQDSRFKRIDAATDAVLSLILLDPAPVSGLIYNPLHRLRAPRPDMFPVVRVTRLDGPDYSSARALVDLAIAAEENGLRGRAYIDKDLRGDGFAIGNEWLENTARISRELGFDTVMDNEATTFPVHARFDAPVLYFGWYAQDATGPFTLPGFRFPVGAIAVHIHSFSAEKLRNAGTRWVGPMVAAGVTATVGNTSEPYLSFTHHPDALLAALVNGANFADAAYFSLLALGWQNVAIGDPLYTPFAKPLKAQLDDLRDPAEILLNQYAAIRALNLIERNEGLDRAVTEGRRLLAQAPGPALALRLAQLLQANGNIDQAGAELEYLARVKIVRSNDWMLYRDIALKLNELNRTPQALHIFDTLLKIEQMPEPLVRSLLNEAITIARASNAADLVARWTFMLRALQAKDQAAPATQQVD